MINHWKQQSISGKQRLTTGKQRSTTEILSNNFLLNLNFKIVNNFELSHPKFLKG